jgi:glycosyltransferase involved in cell wall biosynthesis
MMQKVNQDSQLMAREPRILVNIPILNEIANIERLITGVTSAMSGLDYVSLIVDDGSTDGTIEYLNAVIPRSDGRIVLLPRKKLFKGCQRGAALLAGLKWGLANGRFDIFVELDGDLSHRPEELRDGINAIANGSADIAIASKYVPGSLVTGRTFGRNAISLICNFAVRSLIRWHITDFSNGYRFYNYRAASLIPRYIIRYGSPIYLTEVMAIWLSHKLKVVEIPGHYVGRNEGLSKVRYRDYFKASIGAVEIAMRYRLTGFPEVKTSDAVDPALPAVKFDEPGNEIRES